MKPGNEYRRLNDIPLSSCYFRIDINSAGAQAGFEDGFKEAWPINGDDYWSLCYEKQISKGHSERKYDTFVSEFYAQENQVLIVA